LIVGLFSSSKGFAVPLAALVGLPLYVSGEAAVPLIQTLLKAGAGGGAMLASALVVAGLSTFMKRRVVALYVLFILIGGIVCGYLFDLAVAVMGQACSKGRRSAALAPLAALFLPSVPAFFGANEMFLGLFLRFKSLQERFQMAEEC